MDGFENEDYDLASLWTNRILDDSIVGLGWIKEICGDLRYNLVRDYTTNTALLRTLQSHEIGHNFGLSHAPPSDSSIMAPEIIDTEEWSFFSNIIMNLNIVRFSSQEGCLERCENFIAPNASFSANQNSGCFPLNVAFTDESFGDVLAKKWVFEGGNPAVSYEDNPVVEYNSSGNFDVMLIVRNTNSIDTMMMEDFVDVGNAPGTDFEINYELGGTIGTFTPTSDQTGVTYFWDFGDGTVTNQISPEHDFLESGNYTVTLISSNECASDTLRKDLLVATVPTASFNTNTASEDCAPIEVTFQNTSEGFMTSYTWIFEGGQPEQSNEENPTVVYPMAGNYEVTLMATNPAGTDTLIESSLVNIAQPTTAGFMADTTLGSLEVDISSIAINADSTVWFVDGGLSDITAPFTLEFEESGFHEIRQVVYGACGVDSISQTIELFRAPQASFDAEPRIGCAPLEVQLLDFSTAYKGSYLWTAPGAFPDTSTMQEPMLTYDSAGNYDVQLLVSNLGGMESITKEAVIEVIDIPVADFEFDYSFGDSTVFFNDVSPFGSNYIWDFGDGTTSTQKSPVHTFGVDGQYDVSLIVTNDCGQDTIQKTIDVLFTPSAAFNFENDGGCFPHSIQYNSLIGNTFGTILWIFDGGNPRESLEENPVVSYNTPGVFDVSLYVLTATGTDSLVLKEAITISGTPEVAFESEVDRNAVQFINNSNFSNTYLWDFGDGNTSSDHEPRHTYSNAGTFLVSLTAFNPCDTATISQEVTVAVSRPRAGFSVDVTEGCTPFVVTFIDESFNAESYMWNFPGGNPSTSTEASPVITYTEAGKFSAELLVSNEAGNALIEKLNIVDAKSRPRSNFSYENTGLVYSFSNLTDGAVDSYLWRFDDGSGSEEENPVHEFAETGIYTVSLIATNECGRDTTTIDVPVGVNSTKEPTWAPSINIFPNPNTGSFTIFGQGIESNKLTVEVFDLAGKRLYLQNFNLNSDQINTSIAPENLAAGLYVIKLSDQTSSTHKKITVIK